MLFTAVAAEDQIFAVNAPLGLARGKVERVVLLEEQAAGMAVLGLQPLALGAAVVARVVTRGLAVLAILIALLAGPVRAVAAAVLLEIHNPQPPVVAV